jgi:mono/diheme cytochrome c family protein
MFPKTTLLLALLLCAPALVLAQERQDRASEFPPGEGRELAVNVCASACHDGTAILMKRDGEAGWRRNVERMVVQKGAQLSPADLETLIRYLSTRLGPGSGQMQTPGALPPGAVAGAAKTAKEIQLPPGPGVEVVQTRCVICHDLGRVVSLRRTKGDWDQLTRNMMTRGPQATPAQIDAAIAYLTANFGQ